MRAVYGTGTAPQALQLVSSIPSNNVTGAYAQVNQAATQFGWNTMVGVAQLTPGTTYWFDIVWKNSAGLNSTVSANLATFNCIELAGAAGATGPTGFTGPAPTSAATGFSSTTGPTGSLQYGNIIDQWGVGAANNVTMNFQTPYTSTGPNVILTLMGATGQIALNGKPSLTGFKALVNPTGTQWIWRAIGT